MAVADMNAMVFNNSLFLLYPTSYAPDSSTFGLSINTTNISDGNVEAGKMNGELPVLSRSAGGWKTDVLVRLVVVIVLICVTLVGNVTIVFVLTCAKRYRKHVTRVNVFIVGLAVGDLTVCLFTMTTEVLFFVFDGAWVLGPVACKLVVYVQVVTMASATFILTAMSCDRYVAICHPLRLTGDHVTAARRVIAGAWLLACLLASPQLFIFLQVPRGVYTDTGEIKYVCASRGYTAEWQRKVYFSFMTSYILVVPLVVITFCYANVILTIRRQCYDAQRSDVISSSLLCSDSQRNDDCVKLRRSNANKDAILRAKIRTIKMTLCIICGFVACWSPYFVAHLIDIWTNKQHKEVFAKIFVFTDTAAMMNSVLNPIIYGCFHLKAMRQQRWQQKAANGVILMRKLRHRHHHSYRRRCCDSYAHHMTIDLSSGQRPSNMYDDISNVTASYACQSCRNSFDYDPPTPSKV